MRISRRKLLKNLGIAAAAAQLTPQVSANPAPLEVPSQDVGMLYDATRCIGCKTCMVACCRANGLTPERSRPESPYQDPTDLSARTKSIIKQYRSGDRRSFVKRQCMHCVDPACASVCMLGALHKTDYGVVAYDPERCVGCRYCQVACPFNTPKFQWDSPTPLIVKCEMCRARLEAGKIPACCEACPTKAVVFGKRNQLLSEAKRRIAEKPTRYVHYVYGELEGGGTHVLYLSGLPFSDLGLPALDAESLPEVSNTLWHSVERNLVAPAAVFAALGVTVLRNREKNRKSEETPL